MIRLVLWLDDLLDRYEMWRMSDDLDIFGVIDED